MKQGLICFETSIKSPRDMKIHQGKKISEFSKMGNQNSNKANSNVDLR